MTRNITTVPSFPCKPTAEVQWRADCPHGADAWWTCANTPSGPRTEVHCQCEENR